MSKEQLLEPVAKEATWKAVMVSNRTIRVTDPEGESWLFSSADKYDALHNFLWRWAESMVPEFGVTRM